MALKWLVSRSDAEKLVHKMEQHMQDLSVSLVLINLYVLSASTAKAFTNRWESQRSYCRDPRCRNRNKKLYPKPRAHGSRPQSGRDGPDSDGTSALSCAVSTSTTDKEATYVVRPGSDAGRPIFSVAAKVLRRRIFRELEGAAESAGGDRTGSQAVVDQLRPSWHVQSAREQNSD